MNSISYSQCWEDADILLEGLDLNKNSICLSIASAGENSFSILTKNPKIVYVIDSDPNQLFVFQLKIEAYKNLNHQEFLELMGSKNSTRRALLLNKIKEKLNSNYNRDLLASYENSIIKYGLGGIGKLENYFRIIREYILPLTHSKKIVSELFIKKSAKERKIFYNTKFNNFLWKTIMKLFLSKFMVGLFGRNKSKFKYANLNLYNHIMTQFYKSLVTQDPSNNPYLYWIFHGKHNNILPIAYKKENFELIKNNLTKLVVINSPIVKFIELNKEIKFSAFNLSNIFEYMPQEEFVSTLNSIQRVSKIGARIAYWNMLVDRHLPLGNKGLKNLNRLSNHLYKKDRCLFYKKFNIMKKSESINYYFYFSLRFSISNCF